MSIVELIPASPLWAAYVDHLICMGDAQGALTSDYQPRPSVHYLAAMEDDCIVGSLTLRRQPLITPTLRVRPIYGEGGIVQHEMFVVTFSVEQAHRRKGYGRALQAAGLELARSMGCCQMRSWSGADRTANHALKISMGFGTARASINVDDELSVSGVY